MKSDVTIAIHAAPPKLQVTCSECSLRELCLPKELYEAELARIERVISTRRRSRRGETLFNAGDAFEAVYAVRRGFYKTGVTDGEGHEQVTGFYMAGELLGLDGIGTGKYNGAAVALEDS